MCSINNRVHRPKLVNDGNALPRCIGRKFGDKQAAGPIFLRGERAFSQIQRQIFEEPAVVVEGLRLSVTQRSDGHAQPWGPLIGQRIVRTHAAWTWAAYHLLLLPSHTEQAGDVFVEAPRVPSIDSVVVRQSRKTRVAELSTNDLKSNGDERGGVI